MVGYDNEKQRRIMKSKMYKNGTKGNPVECCDWSMAFDLCRERDCPTWCKVGEEVGKCYPSGHFKES